MRLIERLRCWFESPAATEIRRVKAARARHVKLLARIEQEWHERGAICCPDCMTAGEYGRLGEKVERIDKLIARLERKQKHGG